MVEGRLITVTNGTTVTVFTYDGDGKRVKQKVAPTTTVFIGNYCEIAISGTQRITTTYYYANGQRIALRTVAGVTYIHSDHLGSTAVTSGAQSGDIRYFPYGATRSGAVSTAYKFTGQRLDDSTGLYYYGARYYDAAIGRFVQADSLCQTMADAGEAGVSPLTVSFSKPSLLERLNKANRWRTEAGNSTQDRTPTLSASSLDQESARALAPDNPQVLNRFTYGLNNPLKYTDDTGHIAWIPALILIGAGVGGIGNTVNYVLSNQGHLTWRGGAEAFVEGAIAGGLGTTAGIAVAILAPVAGVGIVGSAALSGAASGFVSNAVSNVLNGQDIMENWASATLAGVALGTLAQSLAPQVGFRAGYSLTKGRVTVWRICRPKYGGPV